MKKVFVLILSALVATALGCSYASESWIPTKIQAARAAGAVVDVEVTEATEGDVGTASGTVSGSATVRVTSYLKGCGPELLTITGFTSSASCGVDLPAVGARHVFFICQSEDGGWTLLEGASALYLQARVNADGTTMEDPQLAELRAELGTNANAIPGEGACTMELKTCGVLTPCAAKRGDDCTADDQCRAMMGTRPCGTVATPLECTVVSSTPGACRTSDVDGPFCACNWAGTCATVEPGTCLPNNWEEEVLAAGEASRCDCVDRCGDSSLVPPEDPDGVPCPETDLVRRFTYNPELGTCTPIDYCVDANTPAVSTENVFETLQACNDECACANAQCEPVTECPGAPVPTDEDRANNCYYVLERPDEWDDCCPLPCNYVKVCDTNVCELPPAVVGPCDAAFPRWSFDAELGECRRFTWGGCDGGANSATGEAAANRFVTREECEGACLPRCQAPPFVDNSVSPEDPTAPVDETVVCDGAELAFSFNPSTQKCEPWEYNNCDGGINRFASRDACESHCTPNCDLVACPQFFVDPCSDEAMPPPEYDNCEKREVRDGCCTLGCEWECPDRPACDQIPRFDVGDCEALIPSWSFDSATGQCESWTFGGCGGNDNRFDSEEACLDTCADACAECRAELASMYGASGEGDDLAVPGRQRCCDGSTPGAYCGQDEDGACSIKFRTCPERIPCVAPLANAAETVCPDGHYADFGFGAYYKRNSCGDCVCDYWDWQGCLPVTEDSGLASADAALSEEDSVPCDCQGFTDAYCTEDQQIISPVCAEVNAVTSTGADAMVSTCIPPQCPEPPSVNPCAGRCGLDDSLFAAEQEICADGSRAGYRCVPNVVDGAACDPRNAATGECADCCVLEYHECPGRPCHRELRDSDAMVVDEFVIPHGETWPCGDCTSCTCTDGVISEHLRDSGDCGCILEDGLLEVPTDASVHRRCQCVTCGADGVLHPNPDRYCYQPGAVAAGDEINASVTAANRECCVDGESFTHRSTIDYRYDGCECAMRQCLDGEVVWVRAATDACRGARNNRNEICPQTCDTDCSERADGNTRLDPATCTCRPAITCTYHGQTLDRDAELNDMGPDGCRRYYCGGDGLNYEDLDIAVCGGQRWNITLDGHHCDKIETASLSVPDELAPADCATTDGRAWVQCTESGTGVEATTLLAATFGCPETEEGVRGRAASNGLVAEMQADCTEGCDGSVDPSDNPSDVPSSQDATGVTLAAALLALQ